jgi:hypothetical protein
MPSAWNVGTARALAVGHIFSDIQGVQNE